MRKRGQFGKAFSFFPVLFLLIIVLAVFFLITGTLIGAGKAKKDGSSVVREKNAILNYWNEEVLTRDFEFGVDGNKQKRILLNLLVSANEKYSEVSNNALKSFLENDLRENNLPRMCYYLSDGNTPAKLGIISSGEEGTPNFALYDYTTEADESAKKRFLTNYGFLANSYNFTKYDGMPSNIYFYYGECS
mgnify:CR=1 FL=1